MKGQKQTSTTVESPPLLGEINTGSPPGGVVKENVNKNRGMEALNINR